MPILLQIIKESAPNDPVTIDKIFAIKATQDGVNAALVEAVKLKKGLRIIAALACTSYDQFRAIFG